MAELEFKYLNEIDISDSLTDSAHVIVEDGGNIRRAPMNQLVTGGGVSSWNDLTDKPFYEENFTVDIEWDGEIGDRVSVPVGMIEGALLVHVNDQFLPADAFTGLEFIMTTHNEDGTIEDLVSTMPSGMMNEVADGVVVMTIPYFASVSHDNAEYDGTVFPKAGTYFILVPNEGFIKSLKGESIVVHKIDKKYIDSPVTVVNISYTYNEETGEYTNVTLDLGYDEIIKAYRNECPIFVCDEINAGVSRYPATVICTEYNEMLGSYLYAGLKYSNVEGMELVISIPHSAIGGEPAMISLPAPSALPEVSTDNDGQILGVVDGAWTSMDAPSGLPEVTAENNGNVLAVVDGAWIAGEIEIPEQINPDWNQNDPEQPDYVKNRTHWVEGSGATIEWDGNAEGRDSFKFENGLVFYKVSDATPSVEELAEAKMTLVVDGSSMDYPLDQVMMTGEGYIVMGEIGFVVAQTPFVYNDLPVEAPSTGVYWADAGEAYTASLTYGSTTYHPLDEGFIPDTIARKSDIPEGSGGGVTSWNELEDKPFYEEINKVAVVENEVMQLSAGSGSNYGGRTSSPIVLTAGEKYTVVVDGEEYVMTAYEGTMQSLSCVCLGDISILNDDNASPDTPICLAYASARSMTLVGVVGAIEEITLSVYKGSTIVHPLDEKFIPDTIARSASSHGLTVSDATGETVTAAEFNALLAILREAGYLAT